MGKDTCIKANTYCPVCRGITGTDCWHSASDFSIPRTDWKQVDELSALRTQNAELLAERAGVISQSKMHPSWLDKSKEEILDCLRFQGATTAALLNQTDEQAERIRELEAEVARLRNALETFIAEHEECGFPDFPVDGALCRAA